MANFTPIAKLFSLPQTIFETMIKNFYAFFLVRNHIKVKRKSHHPSPPPWRNFLHNAKQAHFRFLFKDYSDFRNAQKQFRGRFFKVFRTYCRLLEILNPILMGGSPSKKAQGIKVKLSDFKDTPLKHILQVKPVR